MIRPVKNRNGTAFCLIELKTKWELLSVSFSCSLSTLSALMSVRKLRICRKLDVLEFEIIVGYLWDHGV